MTLKNDPENYTWKISMKSEAEIKIKNSTGKCP